MVRATNRDHPDYYSDAGVMLIVEAEDGDLLFTSELYRLVVRENSPVGTQLNSVPVSVKDAEHFFGVRYKLDPEDIFAISDNGTIFVKRPIDRKSPYAVGIKGIVDLTVSSLTTAERACFCRSLPFTTSNQHSRVFKSRWTSRTKRSLTLINRIITSKCTIPFLLVRLLAVWMQATATSLCSTVLFQVHNASSANTIARILGSAQNIVDVRLDGYIVKSGKGDFEEGHEYDVKVQAIDANGKTVRCPQFL